MAEFTVRVELLNIPKDQDASRKLYDQLHAVMKSHGYHHMPPPTGEYVNPKESDEMTVWAVAQNVKTWVGTVHKASTGLVSKGDIAFW